MKILGVKMGELVTMVSVTVHQRSKVTFVKVHKISFHVTDFRESFMFFLFCIILV